MLSIELHFKENTEFLKYQKAYSSAFRKVYSNAELMDDKGYQDQILAEHPLLTVDMYGSIKSEVKTKKIQHETALKKQVELLEEYNELLEDLDPEDKSYKRDFYKLTKKISRLETRIRNPREIVFGGRHRLQSISYNHNMYYKTKDLNYLETARDHLIEFRKQRILGFYYVGRANENGSRIYDFDFIKGEILFKPNRHEHHLIKIHPGRNQYKILCKIQQMIDHKLLPLTVTLYTDRIIISYDNELLNGYKFKKKECNLEQSRIDKEEKEARKQIFIKYCKELEARKLEDKIPDRFASIDLNPERIGFCVRDSKGIIFKRCFDYTKLLKNTVGNDTTKILYNLSHVYRQIFRYCRHFKVAFFAVEELNFKYAFNNRKQFNRKVKNLWCRSHQTMLIKKYTENLGIQLVEVNPSFSSFIGNMLYSFYDPIASACEIARRGMILKKKLDEPWYPEIDRLRLNNLPIKTYVSNLECWDGKSVKSLYKLVSKRKLRVRNLVKPKAISKLRQIYILA